MMKRLSLLLLLFAPLCAQEGSVVCIHGFMRSATCMIPMSRMLQKEGFSVLRWDYPSRKETIEGHAEHLVCQLQEIAREKPGQPIHFVTHSLGGIILRVAINHPDCPDEAKMGKAVLLAPPNQGSAMGRKLGRHSIIHKVLGEKAGRQLLTYGPQDMELLGQFPPSMEVMVIAGSKDEKVSIEESRLSTPHTHKILFMGHTWIMSCRQSLKLTRHFLQESRSP